MNIWIYEFIGNEIDGKVIEFETLLFEFDESYFGYNDDEGVYRFVTDGPWDHKRENLTKIGEF